MKVNMRKVIVHYHLFKNAGTSFDDSLKSVFGESWFSFEEGAIQGKIPPNLISNFIINNPNIKVISSHSLTTPLINNSVHFEVIPVIFIRHPIDRAYSAYLFEVKKQNKYNNSKMKFKEYIDLLLLEKNKNAIENFQAIHLFNDLYDGINYNIKNISNDELANKAIDRLRAFKSFGVVDEYSTFIKAFEANFKAYFPDLKIDLKYSNAMQDNNLTIELKIENIRNILGDESFNKLVSHNMADLKLYEFAKSNYLGKL